MIFFATFTVVAATAVNTNTINTSIPMKNAAQKDMHFPTIGFGTRGSGYKIGQKEQCWYWPTPCCTKDHCPAINATRDYIKLAISKGLIPRIDVGYPYGDHAICPNDTDNDTDNDKFDPHPSCNTMGIGEGIRQSGVKRSDIFITAKCGFAGPMGNETGQISSILERMKIDYADLCLIHEPEIGPGTGSHGGTDVCDPAKDYNAKTCRVDTYKNVYQNMQNGKCKSIGVNNWNVSDVKELEEAGLVLPSVVQYKFHLHQSLASPWQKDLMDYCGEKGIIFNGIAPLGTPDWVTFIGDGMKATALEEPKVNDIANKVGKSPAQVLQRWIIQQGIAIQTRSMDQDHMKENLDVFDWE
eukprot:1007730_1